MAKKTKITEPATVVRGEVTVTKLWGKIPVKKITINNNAVANLLIGVARYIRGDFVNIPREGLTFIPAYLGIGYTEDKAAETTSFSQVKLYGELEDARYRFDVSKGSIDIDIASTPSSVNLTLYSTIPSGALPVDTHINELGLFANREIEQSGLLARIVYLDDSGNLATALNDSDGEHHIKVEAGASYQIEWKILLSNQ